MSQMAQIDTVTLVNLVTGEKTVPEFLGPDCRAPSIADALVRLLADNDARDAQKKAMSQTMIALGQGEDPPGLRAAHSVLKVISR